jgi:transcriptional regulator with XRE-family HTH domain
MMLGLTQQQLAELIGTTYQQAHKYEKGVNRVSAGRLHAIARALGVEPGYFFEGLGEGEPARPSPQRRLLLDLARSFAALPRRQQEALADMARALAGVEARADRDREAGGNGMVGSDPGATRRGAP